MRPLNIVLIPFLLLIGCSTKSSIVKQQYSQEYFGGKKVVILPPNPDSFFVKNINDVRKAYPNDTRSEKEIIREAFYGSFCFEMKTVEDILQSHVKIFEKGTNISVPWNGASAVFSKTLVIDTIGTKINFLIPRKDWLSAQNKLPDFLLIMNAVTFYRDDSAAYIPNYKPSGSKNFYNRVNVGTVIPIGIERNKIYAVIDYMVYDYEKETWVTYGRLVSPGFGRSDDITKDIWREVYRLAARRILNNSPWEVSEVKYF